MQVVHGIGAGMPGIGVRMRGAGIGSCMLQHPWRHELAAPGVDVGALGPLHLDVADRELNAKNSIAIGAGVSGCAIVDHLERHGGDVLEVIGLPEHREVDFLACVARVQGIDSFYLQLTILFRVADDVPLRIVAERGRHVHAVQREGMPAGRFHDTVLVDPGERLRVRHRGFVLVARIAPAVLVTNTVRLGPVRMVHIEKVVGVIESAISVVIAHIAVVAFETLEIQGFALTGFAHGFGSCPANGSVPDNHAKSVPTHLANLNCQDAKAIGYPPTNQFATEARRPRRSLRALFGPAIDRLRDSTSPWRISVRWRLGAVGGLRFSCRRAYPSSAPRIFAARASSLAKSARTRPCNESSSPWARGRM